MAATDKDVLPRYPLTERIMAVSFPAENAEEVINVKRGAFAERLKSEFPEGELTAEWRLGIVERGGVPTVGDAKVSKTYYWWSGRGRPRIGVGLKRNSFLMHYQRDSQESFMSFVEMRASFERLLLLFIDHFGIDVFDGVRLEYINTLSREMMPQFISSEMTPLGRILRVFGLFPKPEFVTMEAPLKLQMNFVYDTDLPSKIRVQLWDKKDTKTIWVGLFGSTIKTAKQISGSRAMRELDACHEHVNSQFEWTFTDEALKSFKQS